MYLEELKTTDLDKDTKYTFVVSLGSTEQHGPFLPLGSDTFIHNEIIRKSEKLLPSVIFLPTVPISCAKEHKGFIGSVWVEEKTLHNMLENICTSLYDNADKIIFSSWHGGNVIPLDNFVKNWQKKFPKTSLHHARTENRTSDIAEKGIIKGPIDEHAGNTEISMVLSLKPSQVSIPQKNYPKKITKNVWSKGYVIKSSKDGIVDNHPKWIISKSQGKTFIDIHADVLVKAVKKILKN